MTWITYQENQIIHLPSLITLIAKSVTIASKNELPEQPERDTDYRIIRDSDTVYNLETEDDRCKYDWEGYGLKRYSREQGQYHVDNGYGIVGRYHNLTECFAVVISSGGGDRDRILFMTTGKWRFRGFWKALQADLRAINYLDKYVGERPTDVLDSLLKEEILSNE